MAVLPCHTSPTLSLSPEFEYELTAVFSYPFDGASRIDWEYMHSRNRT